jgi:two-component system phosphate regulon sensor histidine kinase PhoR
MHELLRTASVSYPNVTLDLTAPTALIRADRYHLETVLNNLIDNALKYCDTSPSVRLHTRSENGLLIWSVIDNGIGIAPEYHKAIFKQFFRVPAGHTHDVKGFGLGLYYVQQVVRAHGWQLSLTSKMGVGSVFEVKSAYEHTLARTQQHWPIGKDKFVFSYLKTVFRF